MLFTVNKPNYHRPVYRTRTANNKHTGNFRPKVNVIETTNDFQLQMLVPGWSRADLNVKVEDDLLSISAEKALEQKDEVKFTHKEFELSGFKRSFVLPDNVDQETISATVNDGVLVVTMSKKAVFKKEIAVA